MSLNGLETRTLWLTVWHSDMFGRNDFLGEVMMTLENKVFDDPTPRWYNLQERVSTQNILQNFKLRFRNFSHFIKGYSVKCNSLLSDILKL